MEPMRDLHGYLYTSLRLQVTGIATSPSVQEALDPRKKVANWGTGASPTWVWIHAQ